jgi:hypothetical protein
VTAHDLAADVEYEAWAADEAEPDQSTATTSWQPIDLRGALDGGDIEPATLMRRRDGIGLLYPGRTHSIAGEPEALKGWAVQAAVAAELLASRDVVYVDYEDDEHGVVARLRALGVPADQIIAGLTYLRPEEPLATHRDTPTLASVHLDDLLATHPYALAVIDGVTEAMTTEGLDLRDNADIARWMRRLPRRIADTGPAVVCVDHVTKDADSRGRFAIGGQHKLAGITGASYLFTVIRPLSRALLDPVEALVKVTVTKDRPGHVRSHTAGGTVAMLAVTSYPDGGVTVHLEPPTIAGQTLEPDLELQLRILGYLTAYDGSSGRSIEDNVTGKGPRIREALRWMSETGLITIEPKGTSHLHWLTNAGRATLE